MLAINAAEQVSAGADFSETFAAFSSSLRVDALPRQAIVAAKTNLYDTLGCAVAGRSAPGVESVVALVKEWGGAPQASVLFTDIQVPAHHAAWANGVMAHARDYDDTHDAAVLHAGVSVVPAALAAAELRPDASGADLLAGIAAGLELICRLGVATRIGIIESGFIYSSLFGYFAATAAAARVLELDADETVNALGIAYSQAAGTHQVTRDAAMTKRMQPGFAAKAALVSVQLAQRKVRGAQNTFEGLDGLFRTYLRDAYDPAALRQNLGSKFEFTALSYKPYPCCRFNHTAIDAALAIRTQPGFRPDRVRRIVARVNRQAYEAVCTPAEIRQAPQTIVQAQFSIPFTVATALVTGGVRLSDFTEPGIRQLAVLSLAARTEAEVDDAIEREWSRSISPTHLIVDTKDGVFEARVDDPRGHPKAPMTASDFDAKFADALAFSGVDWPDGTMQWLRESVDRLERLPQASSLMASLRTHA